MWVGEALHPFNVFTDAGFEVNLVSEKGSYSADQWSETKDWLTDEEIVVWKDPNSAFRKKLDEHLKPADFKAEDVWIRILISRALWLKCFGSMALFSSRPDMLL